jgi:hypothetical protein
MSIYFLETFSSSTRCGWLDNLSLWCYFEAQMKSRDVIVGFVFLVILIAGVLWIFKNKNSSKVSGPVPTPVFSSKIDELFPNLNIPEGVEKIELKDVTGSNNFGIATRTEIVANLPEGRVYNGWLVNSEGKKVLLGTLKVVKSGWMLSYASSRYPGYNKVIVSQNDNTILEGSF